MKRLIAALLSVVGVVLLAWFALHFPWAAAGRAIERASLPLVLLVVAANLLSLVAKAAAWGVLLRRRARPGVRGPRAARYRRGDDRRRRGGFAGPLRGR